MRGHPLESAYLKIERADQHIVDLERRVKEFFSGNVYELVIEPEAQTGSKLAKIRLKGAIPPIFQMIVGDVLSNLRASLDHAATALASLKNPQHGSVYFPFAASRDKFFSPETKRKIKAFPDEAGKVFETLQPYKGGNDLLWAIHQTRNDDSHNFILPAQVHGTQITIIGMKIEGTFIWGPGFRLDEGIVFAKLGTTGTVGAAPGYDQAQIVVAGDISFGDVDVVRGQPVLAALREMRKLAAGVLDTFGKELFPQSTA